MSSAIKGKTSLSRNDILVTDHLNTSTSFPFSTPEEDHRAMRSASDCLVSGLGSSCLPRFLLQGQESVVVATMSVETHLFYRSCPVFLIKSHGSARRINIGKTVSSCTRHDSFSTLMMVLA